MKLPTFSYSKWDKHSGKMGCPRKMRYSMIDYLCTMCFKGPVPRDSKTCPFCNGEITKSVALTGGLDFAKAVELFIKGESDVFPDNVRNMTARMAILKLKAARATNPAKILVEPKFFFDVNWNPTHQNQFGPNSGGLDILVLDPETCTAQVIDWKTGSVTDVKKQLKKGVEGQYDNQLELYATMVFKVFPWVQEISTHIYYVSAVDVGRTDRRTYVRAELPGMAAKWKQRQEEVNGDTTFAPRIGFWCGFCDFAPKKGGPCPTKVGPGAAQSAEEPLDSVEGEADIWVDPEILKRLEKEMANV